MWEVNSKIVFKMMQVLLIKLIIFLKLIIGGAITMVKLVIIFRIVLNPRETRILIILIWYVIIMVT